jgi:RHS repeat-associated protein
MTDASGAVVWAAEYLPFGQADVSIETIENNLRFPGQYFDLETGFHYDWHRYYDPETGRYLTPDPIGLAGGMNLYAYVQNDPINYLDPTGLSKFLIKQFVQRSVKAASNSYFKDIDPAGRRIVSAGIGGAAGGAVAGALVGTPALGVGAAPSALGGSIIGFSTGLLIQTSLEAAGLGQTIEDFTGQLVQNFMDAIVDDDSQDSSSCP